MTQSGSGKTDVNIKPPNILVYTAEGKADGSILKKVFIGELLNSCLYFIPSFLISHKFAQQIEKAVKTDAFVVYPVKADTLLANKCWRDNTQLVVLETKLESGLVKSVQEYLDGGGKIWDLSDNHQLKHDENYVSSSTTKTVLNQPEIATVLEESFHIAINTLDEVEEENIYTFGFLFGATDKLRSRSLVKQKKLTLDFQATAVQRSPSESYLPVREVVEAGDCPQFDQELYFSHLRTSSLGRVLVYVPVMTSSMDVFEGSPLCDGLAVVPARQTQGVGRGGNRWLREGSV